MLDLEHATHQVDQAETGEDREDRHHDVFEDGAEIEQALVAALYAAHAAGAPLSQPMVVESLRDTRPLSVMMREQVDALRNWARERTVPAD